MTKLRTCSLFAFLPTRSRKERLRLTAAICIVLSFCAAAAIATPAQDVFFTVLAGFDGTNGGSPWGALAQGRDGNFYGSTNTGGANNIGTVFRVTPAGVLTMLHSFNGGDGSYPVSGVVQGSDGNFYGTTVLGGAHGGGVIFKITPTGALTTFYNFCSQPNCADGGGTHAGLVQATDGNFYGTTFAGGADNDCPIWPGNGCGTVFKITPAGVLTSLYSFCAQPNCTDGDYPYAGLVQGSDGNLYGTTQYGGDRGCDSSGWGCGTVFRITPNGTLTTLHSFDGGDGAWPYAGLVQGRDGYLYGLTSGDGAHNYGTVFKISSSGTLTTLHSFDGGDGTYPETVLVQASDGNFYGTAGGGAYGWGEVFKLTPGGNLTVLHSFCSQPNCGDGGGPEAGLVQATDGSFYGTTAGGGPGAGTVFRMGVARACATCRP